MWRGEPGVVGVGYESEVGSSHGGGGVMAMVDAVGQEGFAVGQMGKGDGAAVRGSPAQFLSQPAHADAEAKLANLAHATLRPN